MKAIYTVITGNCDNLKNGHKQPGWDLICFTDDRRIKSDVWDVRYIKEIGDRKKLSRKYKILAHQYLSEYETTLYIDSCILISKDLSKFIEGKKGFWVKQHPRRTDIYEEAARIIERGKDEGVRVLRQAARYMAEGFESGLYENGIMLRDNSEETKRLNKAWWAEVLQGSYRDQISLPYAEKKAGVKVNTFKAFESNKYFMILNKRPDRLPAEVRIHEGTPYGADYQYGQALNDFCSSAPDDSWILVRDRDTLYLTDNGQQIIDIVKRHSDTGVFGCMTNRLGLKWQLVDGMFDETDIVKHKEKAEQLKEAYGTEVMNPNLPVGGMFLLFKKSIWEKVPFREGDIVQNSVYFDWDFCIRVKKIAPIRIMMGVYVFHQYRLGKNVRDVTHIMR